MRESIKCKKCSCETDVLFKCDICGIKKYVPEITLIIDSVDYHFCELGHAIRFLADELIKKEKTNETIH